MTRRWRGEKEKGRREASLFFMGGRAGTAPPVADEACPPQGSGPIFTARRVWKSVCRNEGTRYFGKLPVDAPSSVSFAATFPPGGRRGDFCYLLPLIRCLVMGDTASGPPGASAPTVGGRYCFPSTRPWRWPLPYRGRFVNRPYGGLSIPPIIHPAFCAPPRIPKNGRRGPPVFLLGCYRRRRAVP